MAQVYSTVLEGKPLGQGVRLRSEEWKETGGTPAESYTIFTDGNFGIFLLVRTMTTPIGIILLIPGLVSRQRAYTWFKNRESKSTTRLCMGQSQRDRLSS